MTGRWPLTIRLQTNTFDFLNSLILLPPMKVGAILAYLCFFLITGGHTVHTTSQAKVLCNLMNQTIDAVRQDVSISSIKDFYLNTVNRVGQENNYAGMNDVEAEDNNTTGERKLKSTTDPPSTVYCCRTIHAHVTSSPFVARTSSYKYILQRVLRV